MQKGVAKFYKYSEARKVSPPIILSKLMRRVEAGESLSPTEDAKVQELLAVRTRGREYSRSVRRNIRL